MERSRLDKAKEFMNQKELDGLIVYSNGAANILRPNHLHFFSGCRPMGCQNAAVLSKSGDVVLLVTPRWDQARVCSKTWIQDVRGSDTFINDLVNVLSQLELKGRVGVAGSDEMNIEVYEGINEVAEIVRADDLTPALAYPKTEMEIENARKAGRAADAGYRAFMENALPGIKEHEFLAEIELSMRLAGADDNFNLLSSGKHNQAMHAPMDRKLEAGDVIIAEISPVVDGQVLQICRTMVLGKASKLLIEKYEMLVNALQRSLMEVRPGNPASAMAIAMNNVISKAGYAEYCAPPYMRARGHGMGLGSVAPGGVIDDETEAIFQKDQVVVVHPNQYLPETGYLACGETVLITDTGYERLQESLTRLFVKEL